MSEQRARQMLAATAGRFRLRNTRTSALPDNWLLGLRVSGPDALETLLQWAIDIAVRSAVERALAFGSGDMRGLTQWGLLQYRYAPFPEHVEMVVEFRYSDGTDEQFVVTARRIVRELPLGGLSVRVSVDVTCATQVRTSLVVHADGIEQPGRPSGKVITMESTSSSRPAPAQGASAPRPSANTPQTRTPGAALPPNYLFRNYSSSPNGPLTPMPVRPVEPPDIFRTYPSPANTPRTPSRRTGHPLGR